MCRLGVTTLALIALAVAGCTPEPQHSRIIVLGLDGLDPDVVDIMIDEGALPNLARIRNEGASGRLRTMRPILSPIIWTTIATGRRPEDHGISNFTAGRTSDGERLPVTSSMRKVKALWQMFSERDREVGIVGYWATWPPEPVKGSVVSDHTAYHFLFDAGLKPTFDSCRGIREDTIQW